MDSQIGLEEIGSKLVFKLVINMDFEN